MTAILDKLPVELQHLILALLPVLLGWAGSDLVPWLKDQNPAVAYVVGLLVTLVTAWFTKATVKYGVGSRDAGAHEA